MSRCTRSLTIAAALLAAACDGASPSAPAPDLPPLAAAVWHVHRSDGQPMPALLGHRILPGNVLEQDFVDSSRVEIAADGTWAHRAWFQRFRSLAHVGDGTTLDWGTWTATPTSYEFRRNTGELVYTLAGPPGDELSLNLVYPGQAGVAVSLLRKALPPPTIHGRWRATSLRGEPLPSAYVVDPEFPTDSGLVSAHVVIDSAVVFLYPNNGYLQRIYHSEWWGPPNGERQTKRYAFVSSDFGSWTKTGQAIAMESAWLQNRTMTGEAAADTVGPLHLFHGITHGDEPAAFRYVRQ